MKPAVAKRLRLLASVLSVLVVLTGAFAYWFYLHMRASLPLLDGSVGLPALAQTTTVERDNQGVPTIHGQNRQDVSRALGFLHGQDRFFQMDLARRRAAGELSELIGKATIEVDKRSRTHGFRRLAQTVLSRLPKEEIDLLQAYTDGVNQGLAHLKSPPFEYAVLRTSPAAWKVEDSVLLIYAMTLDLQDDRGTYEQSLAAVRDILGNGALAYFAPLVGPDDAAIDGSTAPLSPMPTEKMIDLRTRVSPATETSMLRPADDDSVLPGSNGFALAGSRTSNGAAMVANDMHLTLRLPNIWYRASLVFPHPVSGESLRITGVTLPGTPLMVAGSNGKVAWGFTNGDADVGDLVVIDSSSLDKSIYLRGKDLLQTEKRREIIQVKGGDPVVYEVPWTVFGPIVGENAQHRLLALKWTMHDPDAANYALIGMETATTVEEGVAVAHRSGIPIQNIVLADSTGKIGWTICGKLPRRVGFDGRLPVSWTYGDRRWDGYLSDAETPVVIAPPSGQIWTANNRILDSEALLRLGDGGYERPQRAARIRDLITPLQKVVPKDLLAVQLDVGAPHLNPWHELLGQVLTENAVQQKKARGDLKALLNPWSAQAEVNSVSYRLVKLFRAHVAERVLTPIFEPCLEMYPDFTYRRFHVEAPLLDLVKNRPAHLLNPAFSTWDELLLAAADDVIEQLHREGVPLERATWGQHNHAKIQHPFAKLNGLIGAWLSLPPDALPGDYDTPRVQAPDDGASERFVVSPGHEDEAIFEMPGGESGHPLSPFFRAGHEQWVKGEASSFLPGKTVHTLTLTPAAGR